MPEREYVHGTRSAAEAEALGDLSADSVEIYVEDSRLERGGDIYRSRSTEKGYLNRGRSKRPFRFAGPHFFTVVTEDSDGAMLALRLVKPDDYAGETEGFEARAPKLVGLYGAERAEALKGMRVTFSSNVYVLAGPAVHFRKKSTEEERRRPFRATHTDPLGRAVEYLRAGPHGTATVRLEDNHEIVVEDGDLTPIRTRPEEQAAATPTPKTEEEEPDGVSYDLAFILNNPIPAKCAKCNYQWAGRDAIRAPSLKNCSCFYCGGRLVPLDKEGYKRRLETLHLHVVGRLTTEIPAPGGAAAPPAQSPDELLRSVADADSPDGLRRLAKEYGLDDCDTRGRDEARPALDPDARRRVVTAVLAKHLELRRPSPEAYVPEPLPATIPVPPKHLEYTAERTGLIIVGTDVRLFERLTTNTFFAFADRGFVGVAADWLKESPPVCAGVGAHEAVALDQYAGTVYLPDEWAGLPPQEKARPDRGCLILLCGSPCVLVGTPYLFSRTEALDPAPTVTRAATDSEDADVNNEGKDGGKTSPTETAGDALDAELRSTLGALDAASEEGRATLRARAAELDTAARLQRRAAQLRAGAKGHAKLEVSADHNERLARLFLLVAEGVSPREAALREAAASGPAQTSPTAVRRRPRPEPGEAPDFMEAAFDHARMLPRGHEAGKPMPPGDVYRSSSLLEIERGRINRPFTHEGYAFVSVGGVGVRVQRASTYRGETCTFRERAAATGGDARAVHEAHDYDGILVLYRDVQYVLSRPHLFFTSHVYGATGQTGHDIYYPRPASAGLADPFATRTHEAGSHYDAPRQIITVEAHRMSRHAPPGEVANHVAPSEVARGRTTGTFFHEGERYVAIGGLLEAGQLCFSYVRAMRVVAEKDYRGETFTYTNDDPYTGDDPAHSYEGCSLIDVYASSPSRLVMTGPVVEFRPDHRISRDAPASLAEACTRITYVADERFTEFEAKTDAPLELRNDCYAVLRRSAPGDAEREILAMRLVPRESYTGRLTSGPALSSALIDAALAGPSPSPQIALAFEGVAVTRRRRQYVLTTPILLLRPESRRPAARAVDVPSHEAVAAGAPHARAAHWELLASSLDGEILSLESRTGLGREAAQAEAQHKRALQHTFRALARAAAADDVPAPLAALSGLPQVATLLRHAQYPDVRRKPELKRRLDQGGLNDPVNYTAARATLIALARTAATTRPAA